MSYDAWLDIDAGGPEPVSVTGLDVNYTYNCGPMFHEAVGLGLRDLNGPAAQAAATIREALCIMVSEPDRFRALNPDNGWGDYEGFMRFLSKIADACEAAPLATLHVN